MAPGPLLMVTPNCFSFSFLESVVLSRCFYLSAQSPASLLRVLERGGSVALDL